MNELIGWILVAELGAMFVVLWLLSVQLERSFALILHNQSVAVVRTVERIDGLERAITNVTKDLIRPIESVRTMIEDRFYPEEDDEHR